MYIYTYTHIWLRTPSLTRQEKDVKKGAGKATCKLKKLKRERDARSFMWNPLKSGHVINFVCGIKEFVHFSMGTRPRKASGV